ncbi:LAMI_0E14576g1_1 [Lachancea mirantina]|uniref:LAMI_0E14576g1_1 n=1 Tax=Lachancea mirantina TaxID=1230905 RepID=A0A1G4JRM7_9SACH|nr:LAMI_0E14576g1_1 [Lachancea mirantina]
MIIKVRRTHRKTGCIQCKVRKKRCSEGKPSCDDCERLGFDCVYLEKSCTRDQASELKRRVEHELKRRNLQLKKRATFANPSDEESETRDLFSTTAGDGILDENCIEAVNFTPISASNDLLMIAQDAGSVSDLILDHCEESPILPLFPSLHDPMMSKLDGTALHLYNYYREHLAQIISIAPVRYNYYLQIFLPMAHQHEGIMYGLLAWSAHHLAIGGSETSANNPNLSPVFPESPGKYRGGSFGIGEPEGNSSHLTQRLADLGDDSCDKYDESASTALDESNLESINLALNDRANGCHNGSQRYAELASFYTLESLKQLQTSESVQETDFLFVMAQLLVLCGAEICQGDVGRWRILLRLGAKLIREHVGDDITHMLVDDLKAPGSMTTRHWLLANFIYHDIMGSESTHFPMEQYASILDASLENDGSSVDPLHGVNRPIFRILGDVMNVARSMKREGIASASHEAFGAVMRRAQTLQAALYNAQPSPKDVAWYDGVLGSELCHKMFQVFRTAALLLLKTAIFRQQKSSFEVQYLASELSSGLDFLLGTRLEGGLCFPMFMLGVSSTEPAQRADVEHKFGDYINRYKCRNVARARAVVRKLWRSDDDSSSHGNMFATPDWFDVLEEMQWDLNFA